MGNAIIGNDTSDASTAAVQNRGVRLRNER